MLAASTAAAAVSRHITSGWASPHLPRPPRQTSRGGARRVAGGYTGRYLNGTLDELRVWTRALDSTEIMEKMSKPLAAGDETGLLFYFPLDEAVRAINPAPYILHHVPYTLACHELSTPHRAPCTLHPGLP